MKKTIILMITALMAMQIASAQNKNKKKDAQQQVVAEQQVKQNNNTMILLETTMGNIKMELFDDTPVHTNNFKKLVEQGFYDGVLFHRVIEGFMIQTGDPESKTAKPGDRLGAGGPGYTIPAEIIPAHYHRRGAVAYIVHGKTTSADQLKAYSRYGFEFSDEQLDVYATVGGAPTLDAQYTVFGQVVDGMDVVDKIATAEKDAADRPKTDIKIIKASIIK